MKMKVLGTAVAAALLGLSTVTFGQAGSGAAGASGPSGQDTAREASRAQSGSGSATGGAVTSGSGAVVTTPGATVTTTPGVVTTRCDAMTGEERTRCLRDARASEGSSSAGVPTTQRPGDSGPGALDKTNPGQQRGTAPAPKDAGTSSAGSPGGK